MEKEFVQYIEALTLKELGFNEVCFTYFLNGIIQPSLNPKDYTYFKEMSEINKNMLNYENVLTPTYSQAFRFFREKYGIMYRITSYAFGYQIHLDNTPEPKFWNTDRRFDSDVDYEIYEEAELDCLKKLIEIVKEK